MASQLDIVIPVYNEGLNIVAVLSKLAREVKTPARVLICTTAKPTTRCRRSGAIRKPTPACRSSSCATARVARMAR